jgi:hypothetical protein
MGGTGALGTFQRIDTATSISSSNHKRSFSVSAVDGSTRYTIDHDLTPTEMGRQELYIEVPFTAVFGLQRKEHAVSQAFAEYAAHLEVDNQINLTPSEKKSRLSHASMILLDDIEFEANVVTVPLVFAVIVAAASQFLVGYGTGVMNAPAKVGTYMLIHCTSDTFHEP